MTITATKNRATIATVMFFGFLLATLLAWSPLVGTEPAQAALPTDSGKIAFASDRTTGTGVNNPQGDYEIFIMSPNGMNPKQLTRNAVDDFGATLSSDGKKVAYASRGDKTSNPQGDYEIYLVNALDGSGKKNLTNNGTDIEEYDPVFSPNGQRIAYESGGKQTSNPQGDAEVYTMSALDGSGKKNLTNNDTDIEEYNPVFSPDGRKIAYESYNKQTSNPEGDTEVYLVNANGTGKKNLTNNAEGVHDFSPAFSPDGQKITFTSSGSQTSNPEGDYDVYTMNALDGSGQSNFTFTSGGGVSDFSPAFSPDGQRIAFTSSGAQTSNPEGDYEVYVRNTSGLGEINLTNNGASVRDFLRDFSPDGRKVTYYSHGIQTSNPEGDSEIYSLNSLDGLGKKNLTNNKASDTDPD